MQPLHGVIPVLQVAAAPVALDQALVCLAVTGRAADVRCHHGDTAGGEVLVQRLVERALLRLGAAVNRQDDGNSPFGVARAVQPRGDVAAVERGVRDQLSVDERVFRRYPHPALRDGAGLAGRRLDDEDLGRTARARQDDGCAHTVVRQRYRRLESRQVRSRAAREIRRGEIAASRDVAELEHVPTVLVDDPGEHAAVM